MSHLTTINDVTARIGVVKVKESQDKVWYYSIIPATVLYNKELKENEKLL